MSTVRKIAKNTGLMVGANIVNLAMGFIINVYIARYFDVSNFGIVNWAINLATIFILVTDLGIGSFLTIELPRHPERIKDYLSSALSIKLCMQVIALAGITTVAFFGHVSGYELAVLYIIALYVILTAIAQLLQSVFQAFQSMEHQAVCQVANGLILGLGTVTVVTLNLGVIAFSLVYLAAGIAVLAYTLAISLLFYTPPSLRYDRALWKQILTVSIPLSMVTIFSYLYFKLDIQLIEMLISDGKVSVGYYSAAFKLIEAAIVLPALFTSVVFPVMSLYFHKNDPKLGFLLKKSIKYFYMLGAPIAIGTILMAPSFIYFLYSNKYEPSIGVLQMLGLGMFFIYVNGVPSAFLAAANMQIANVKINAVCLIINVGLNLLLIPTWGILGSAFAMVVTQFAMALMTYIVIKRSGYRYIDMKEVLIIAACTVLMGVYVYCLREYNMLLVVGSAMIIYFGSILLSGAITKEDIMLARSIFKKEPVESMFELH
jgi:O-antigen/teichoic acid export membrane protein